MTDRNTTNMKQKIQEEAVGWHVLLSGDAAREADWLAFTDWLEADEKHRQAYDLIEDILSDLAEVERNTGVTQDNVIDARHRWRRKWTVAMAAIAASLIVITGIYYFIAPNRGVQQYATAIGEQRLITLTDGTTVQLNTNSRLRVMFAADVRKTSLDYGQGLFTVTKDRERPFVVNIGDSRVHVVGTVFDILRHNDEIRVTVARGVVEVAPQETAILRKTVRLLPGSQLIHHQGTSDIKVTTIDPAAVIAWKDGFLEYDNARLIDVANDLNRYFSTPIRIVGTAQNIRFSGVIRTADENSALLILSQGLPVYVEKKKGEMLVLPNTN